MKSLFTTISAAILAIISINHANASTFNNQDCAFEFTGKVNFENRTLTYSPSDSQTIVINESGSILVDDKPIELSNKQSKLAEQYIEQTENTVISFFEITDEALTLTNVTLTEVFTAFLGEESELPASIDTSLGEIQFKMRNHIYSDPKSVTFNSDYLDQHIGLNGQLEEKIEELSSQLVQTAMGDVFSLLGKALVSDEQDIESFAQRMETMSEELETKVDKIAKQLEEKSVGLCDNLEALDAIETKLQNVPELKNLDIISINED